MIVPCSLTMAMYVPGPNDVVGRAQQLGADEHGQQAAREEEEQDADHVLHPDNLVVVGHAEVAHPALLRRVRRELVAEDLGQRVVEPADASHPADHAEGQAEDDGDVVLPGVLDLGVAAGDDVAQPVADQVADDATRHGPDDVRLQPGRTAPRRAALAAATRSPPRRGTRTRRRRCQWPWRGSLVSRTGRDRVLRDGAHVTHRPWAAGRRTSPPWSTGPRCRGSSPRRRRWRRGCRSARRAGAAWCSPATGRR